MGGGGPGKREIRLVKGNSYPEKLPPTILLNQV